MRILSVFWCDEVKTGAQKRLVHLLRGLAARNYEVTLLTKEGYNFDVGSANTIEFRDGITPSRRINSIIGIANRSSEKVNIYNTDLVIGFGIGSAVPGSYLKKITGAKLIYAMREHPVRIVWERSILKQKIFEMKNKIYFSAILREADYFVVQVETHKEELVRKHKISRNNIRVIPNNIGVKSYISGGSKEVEEIAFVGTISKRKGIDVLLKSARILKEREVVLKLHIAGEGPMEEWAQTYVSENNLEGQVTFHGFLDQVRRLMVRCDLVVIPSRVETFPNVALEAMSVGTPFIASDLRELRSAFGKATEHFPVGDPVALSDKIEALCEPERYERLKEKTEARREEFAFDWVGEFEKVMQEMAV
jgi:glycosyltransferase involved in cell wall biosynthesis